MDKQKIIRKFLERGYQITKDVLEKLPTEELDEFFNFITSNVKEIFITEKHFLQYLSRKSKPEFVKLLNGKLTKVEEIQTLLIERFKKFQKIASKKFAFQLVSIDKGKTMGNFQTLAMVVDKSVDSLIIEDLTGSLEISVDNVKNYDILETNDVAVFKISNNKLKQIKFLGFEKKAKELNFSIGINREAGNFHVKFEKPYEIKDSLIKVGKFAILNYLGYKFLFLDEALITQISKKWKLSLLETLSILLEKRHLNPKLFYYKEDPLMLDTIPDVIIVKSKENFYKNYKNVHLYGINLKSCEINLSKHEIIK